MHPGTTLTDAIRQWQTPGADSFRSRGGERKNEPGLDQQARNWKTPHGLSGTDRHGVTAGGGGEFAKQALQWSKLWPTARAMSGGPETLEQKRARGSKGGGNDLQAAARNWPTPVEDNANNCGGPARTRGVLGGKGYNDLSVVAALFPTPAARDYRAPNSAKHANKARGHRGQLPNYIAHRFSLPGLTTSNDGPTSSDSTPKLNPQFVEFLMGFPLAWTDCGASVTAWFPLWLRLHSLRSRELSYLLAGSEER